MTTKEELIHTAFYNLMQNALVNNETIDRSHATEDQKEDRLIRLHADIARALEGMIDGVMAYEEAQQ